jgi:hypothetical protein
VEEINENFTMEEVNSEDKPDILSRIQPADDYDDSDEGRVYRVMCRVVSPKLLKNCSGHRV